MVNGNENVEVILFKTTYHLTEQQAREVKDRVESEAGNSVEVIPMDAREVIAQAIKDGIDPNDTEGLKNYLQKYIEQLICAARRNEPKREGE